MTTSKDRTKVIVEYLGDIVKLSSEEISYVQLAISAVHELSGGDGISIFNKMDKIISISEDLSWVISSLNKYRHDLNKQIKIIKDPEFTMLVRKGRPSIQAIESEIRFNHKELTDLEEDLEILDNMIGYFDHLELSIDRYIWMLRDKAKYIK